MITDIRRYIPPRYHSIRRTRKTLQAPVLRPCTELSSAPWVRRDPHRLLRPDAPLHSRGFTLYLALGPPHCVGRFPFRALFTFGLLGVRPVVSPKTTHHSHCHPVERFPCPAPWTLQRGLGGGSLSPCTAYSGSQPGYGVASRLAHTCQPDGRRSAIGEPPCLLRS